MNNNQTVPSPSYYDQLVYGEIAQNQILLGSLVILLVLPVALLIYASSLHFPDELEYIWPPKFTLPTFLYLLSKYPLLLYQTLGLIMQFLPETSGIYVMPNSLGKLKD
ncbi:hypothetical protein Clacol_009750 [Clathrus columnatus]|uniref:DUF6533 domain-containing protein n=1 Tax=Clathrus columnatus TaxID=1419009 RepID=A0AAV5ANU6_9AGAM|nr:hypothetical protein Clacol_009750 [Clathrus columnatus]